MPKRMVYFHVESRVLVRGVLHFSDMSMCSRTRYLVILRFLMPLACTCSLPLLSGVCSRRAVLRPSAARATLLPTAIATNTSACVAATSPAPALPIPGSVAFAAADMLLRTSGITILITVFFTMMAPH